MVETTMMAQLLGVNSPYFITRNVRIFIAVDKIRMGSQWQINGRVGNQGILGVQYQLCLVIKYWCFSLVLILDVHKRLRHHRKHLP